MCTEPIRQECVTASHCNMLLLSRFSGIFCELDFFHESAWHICHCLVPVSKEYVCTSRKAYVTWLFNVHAAFTYRCLCNSAQKDDLKTAMCPARSLGRGSSNVAVHATGWKVWENRVKMVKVLACVWWPLVDPNNGSSSAALWHLHSCNIHLTCSIQPLKSRSCGVHVSR